MGRQEPSKGLAPPSVRKEQRAKQAKATISKTIPALLAADARARKGVESAELIVEPSSAATPGSHRVSRRARARNASRASEGSDGDQPAASALSSPRPPAAASAGGASRPASNPRAPLRVRVEVTDTLVAARRLHQQHQQHQHLQRSLRRTPPPRNVAVLNMASALRPGGGVRQGATSQEERLCARTTLLPSLREAWYRLPEAGGIWSPDVLVFQTDDDDGGGGGGRELQRRARFYVDVVSAAMMRFPETEAGRYARREDGEMCLRKVRALVAILGAKGCERAVLGAWGCGAYGNPVGEVARAFKKALGEKEAHGLEEVVFAIKEEGMARAFAEAWGEGIEFVERDVDGGGEENGPEDGAEDKKRWELETKIAELEAQIEQTRFPAMRERLGVVLERLKAQLDSPAASLSEVGEADEDNGRLGDDDDRERTYSDS